MSLRFADAVAAILISPVVAASPALALGLASYAAGSPLYLEFVEDAFDFLLVAWPLIVIVGVPLHLVLARLGGRGFAHALSGAAVGVGFGWLHLHSGPSAIGGPPSWDGLAWIGVGLHGALTGWFFHRRLSRRRRD